MGSTWTLQKTKFVRNGEVGSINNVGFLEVLEEVQVFLRHRRVLLPVLFWVNVEVRRVAFVGDFGDDGRLQEQKRRGLEM